jgi:hypothetical protein
VLPGMFHVNVSRDKREDYHDAERVKRSLDIDLATKSTRDQSRETFSSAVHHIRFTHARLATTEPATFPGIKLIITRYPLIRWRVTYLWGRAHSQEI